MISDISEDLLSRFRDVPLLDPYSVYEQLMSYWHETMQDDVYLVMHEGWLKAAQPRRTIEDKARKLSENPDIVIGSGRSATKYKTDLIPSTLIVARYFSDQQAELETVQLAADDAARAVEECVEEYAVDGGPLDDTMDDKISKALVASRLAQAQRECFDPDEVTPLERLMGLYNTEGEYKRALKGLRVALDTMTIERYGHLNEDEVKRIVLDDKWAETIGGRIGSAVNGLTLELVARLQELGERYAATVSELDSELSRLEDVIARHLADMGVK